MSSTRRTMKYKKKKWFRKTRKMNNEKKIDPCQRIYLHLLIKYNYSILFSYYIFISSIYSLVILILNDFFQLNFQVDCIFFLLFSPSFDNKVLAHSLLSLAHLLYANWMCVCLSLQSKRNSMKIHAFYDQNGNSGISLLTWNDKYRRN